MAIIVTANGPDLKPAPKLFPKIMKSSSGNIVLFHLHGRGCCLRNSIGSGHTIGEERVDWDMTAFTDLNDPITLQNE